MRMIVLAIVGALTVGVTVVAGARADAATFPMPAGIGADGAAQEAAYVCGKVWRCGDFSCGWRRVCNWIAPRSYRSYRSYRYNRPFHYFHRW
jgi:hypothetical protein